MTTDNESSAPGRDASNGLPPPAKTRGRAAGRKSKAGPRGPRRADREKPIRDRLAEGGTITLGSPADIRASIPYLLGFTPERSLVFLALTDGKGRLIVTGRVDAPTCVDEAHGCAEAMSEVVQRAGAARVVIAHFGDIDLPRGSERAPDVDGDCTDESTIRELSDLITSCLHESGIEVVGWLWTPREGRRRGAHSTTPAVALASVVAGRRTFKSRSDLAAQVRARPSAQREAIADFLDHLGAIQIPTDDLADALDKLLRRRTQARQDGVAASPLSAQEVALCCMALARIPIRDTLLGEMAIDDEAGCEDMWCEILHIAPEESIAAVATVLAISAYMDGDGVLARCALERALDCDPDYSLAHLITASLDNALPPAAVRESLARAYQEICGEQSISTEA